MFVAKRFGDSCRFLSLCYFFAIRYGRGWATRRGRRACGSLRLCFVAREAARSSVWESRGGGGSSYGRCRHLRGLCSIYPVVVVELFAGIVHQIMPICMLPVGLVACLKGNVKIGILPYFPLLVCAGPRGATFELYLLGSHQRIHVE